MAGALTRASVRLTVATSPFRESRLCWLAITSCPSACSVGITLLKHDPSAQIPWTNTALGLVCIRVLHSRCSVVVTRQSSVGFSTHPLADERRAVLQD